MINNYLPHAFIGKEKSFKEDISLLKYKHICLTHIFSYFHGE